MDFVNKDKNKDKISENSVHDLKGFKTLCESTLKLIS